MSVVLTRSAELYRVRPRWPTPAVQRHAGDLASRVVIVTLFSFMAVRLARDAAATGHVTGILLLASEALVVALTVVRRSADAVDRSWQARLLTMLSTFGPPLVRPATAAAAPEAFTVALTAAGLMIVVLGKMSLGRSFGLTPANRGVVSTGLYRLVRHPIYLGYLTTHVGFLVANVSAWNLVVLGLADAALLVRAGYEERTLGLDPDYRDYAGRVHWRIVPGVY